jgi:hypothetical protein
MLASVASVARWSGGVDDAVASVAAASMAATLVL